MQWLDWLRLFILKTNILILKLKKTFPEINQLVQRSRVWKKILELSIMLPEFLFIYTHTHTHTHIYIYICVWGDSVYVCAFVRERERMCVPVLINNKHYDILYFSQIHYSNIVPEKMYLHDVHQEVFSEASSSHKYEALHDDR